MTSSDPPTTDDKAQKAEKKGFFTWERSIEILKVVVTLWAALLGSFVTMQYNQRQNELNRIQAIAQMLPHISSGEGSKSTPGASANTPLSTPPAAASAPSTDGHEDMSRDGAFWAIFRTADDRNMLRDLAALFPLDIYRVVSSIAVSGELEHDSDALIALQVASEKLAEKYSSDPKHAELAGRLYEQALRLRERKPDDSSPLRVVDLTAELSGGSDPTDDQMTKLIKSINDLADAHVKEIRAEKQKKKSGAFDAKALYKRAHLIGSRSDDQQVQEQVAHADLALCDIYVKEKLPDDAYKYLKDEFVLESKITGKPMLQSALKDLDKDGDGFADLSELANGLKQAQDRLAAILVQFPDRGASVK